MKKIKKLVVLFSVAILCLLPLWNSTLTVQASEPTTWYIKYVEGISEWRFQKGSWEDTGYHRELYYMQLDIKDGDLVVIDGSGDIDLTVNARLSNLTVMNPGTSVVTAKSIDNFYAINNSSSAINCPVTNAYVYDYCSVNFNSNVSYLEVICKTGPEANVAVVGTTGQVKGWDGDSKVTYNVYNVVANTLRISKGGLTTDAANYTTTATATPTAPATPSAPTTSTAPSTGELDDVPKTGDLQVSPVWFLALAAVCLFGYRKLERR